jgi:hypothetical protein
LGGIAWAIGGGMIRDEIKSALLPVADRAAWDCWVEEAEGAPPPLFREMAVPDLARAWIEIMPRSPVEKERDEGFRTLFDYQSDLVGEDPQRGLELVREVLRIERHPRLLGLLAAGLLEDLVCTEGEGVIAWVEAEALRNERFRWLLGGVWYSRVTPEIAQRINAAKGGESW